MSDTAHSDRPVSGDSRLCPDCKRDGRRTLPMPTEIGSWSGERLWRCAIHGVFYARDFVGLYDGPR